jgi:hypothetical protein
VHRSLCLHLDEKHSQDGGGSSSYPLVPAISTLCTNPESKEDLRKAYREKDHQDYTRGLVVSCYLGAYDNPGPCLHTASLFHLLDVGDLVSCVGHRCMRLPFHYSYIESKGVALKECQQALEDSMGKDESMQHRQEETVMEGALQDKFLRRRVAIFNGSSAPL